MGVVPSVRNGTLSYHGTTIPVPGVSPESNLSVQPAIVPSGSDLHGLVSRNARNHSGHKYISFLDEDDSLQPDSFARAAAVEVGVAPSFSQTSATFFISQFFASGQTDDTPHILSRAQYVGVQQAMMMVEKGLTKVNAFARYVEPVNFLYSELPQVLRRISFQATTKKLFFVRSQGKKKERLVPMRILEDDLNDLFSKLCIYSGASWKDGPVKITTTQVEHFNSLVERAGQEFSPCVWGVLAIFCKFRMTLSGALDFASASQLVTLEAENQRLRDRVQQLSTDMVQQGDETRKDSTALAKQTLTVASDVTLQTQQFPTAVVWALGG